MPGSPEHVQAALQYISTATTTADGSMEVGNGDGDGDGGGDNSSRSGVTDDLVMVFLNTAAAAQRFAEELGRAGVQCAQYHNLVQGDRNSFGSGSASGSGEVKERSLQAFREGRVRVLVCTDAAARGLDLPAVRHVVQAEFALNVVAHLHRIGRASRAGRPGRATNMYLADSPAVPLVRSIRGTNAGHETLSVVAAAVEDASASLSRYDPRKSTIEQSFSRKRGFRRNLQREQGYINRQEK